MPNLDIELLHLAQADQHIAQCRRHIRKQIALIRRCSAGGGDVRQAQELLSAMRDTQRVMRLHRQTLRTMLPPDTNAVG
jgi:hypothetical protein